MPSRAREVDLPCVTDSALCRTGVLENGTKGRNLLKLNERTQVPVVERWLNVRVYAWFHVEGSSLIQELKLNVTIDPRQATTPDLSSSSTT